MPKSQDDHLGHKLRRAIKAKAVKQAEVARVFHVTAPTVSGDWIKEGRIHKKHYPKLVEYFGLPYEWWFGPAGADPKISVVTLSMVSMSEKQKDDVVKAVMKHPSYRVSESTEDSTALRRKKRYAVSGKS